MSERREGIVRVSNELLRHLLCFPEGTKIISVYVAADVHDQTHLVVAHPDLPERKPGEPIRLLDPQYSRELVDAKCQFLGWGIEE